MARLWTRTRRTFGAWNDALLFRTLATLRVDVPVFDTIEELRWEGPRLDFAVLANQIKTPGFLRRHYSLFTGDVGTALFAAACLDVDARYPIIDFI